MGLTSRAGVVPLSLLADIAGPMTRTRGGRGRRVPGDRRRGSRTIPPRRRRADAPIPNYAQSLAARRTARARASASCARPTSATRPIPKSSTVFMAAVEDLKRAGATIVDPVRVDLGRRAPARRARARAAASSTTSTAISRRTAIACRCTRSRRSSARAGSTRRSKRGCSRRRTGRRTDPTRRRARRKRSIASAFRAAVAKTMDARQARRVRLSDVEQPAAADRRPEHAARRQQPGVLADDRAGRRSTCRWATRAARCRRA